MTAARRIALGGVLDDAFGGNITSTHVLEDALRALGYDVARFGHRRDWRPGGPLVTEAGSDLILHTRAVMSHSEGVFHRGALRRWLASVGPDAVWVFNSRYASALPDGVRYLLWEATTWRDERNANRLGMQMAGMRPGFGYLLHTLTRPVDRLSERRAFRRATRVAVMSEHVRRCVVEEHLAPAERVEILPHPPSVSFERAAAVSSSSAPGRDFVAVGRWSDPRKAARLLCEAAEMHARTAGTFTWTIVGESADRVCASLARRGVDAREASAADARQLVDVLREHRYLVIPSFQEGFAVVGIEAFHCGVPVVSTRCGGPEEYVAHGRTGFLAETTPKALAEMLAIAGALDERSRLEMGAEALRVARTRYSNAAFRDAVGRMTEEFIRSAGE